MKFIKERTAKASTLRECTKGIKVSLAELVEFEGSRMAIHHLSSAKSAHVGEHVTWQRGQGIEFNDVRPYQPGDDVRSIDWKVTARRDTPYTKCFHAEKDRSCSLLIDVSDSMHFGTKSMFKSVKACLIGAKLLWQHFNEGSSVDSILICNEQVHILPPALQKRVLIHQLNQWASIHNHWYNSGVDLKEHRLLTPLKKWLDRRDKGTDLHIISDFYNINKDVLDIVRLLCHQADLFCWFVYDELEYKGLPAGAYCASDGVQQLHFCSQGEQDPRLLKVTRDRIERDTTSLQSCGAKVQLVSTHEVLH